MLKSSAITKIQKLYSIFNKIQSIQYFLDKNFSRWHQKENELFIVEVSEDFLPLRKKVGRRVGFQLDGSL